MGERFRILWREVNQEFWRTALYVAFWGFWTWFFGILLGAATFVAAAAIHHGSPVLVFYSLLSAFLTFVAMVVAGRVARRRGASARTSPNELPQMRDAFSMVSTASASLNSMPSIVFSTANLKDRHLDTRGTPKKLRFVSPKEQIVEDLPATLLVSKGRIVIKRFTSSGFLIDEDNTMDDLIKAEIYFDEFPVELRSWPPLSRRQISDLRNRLAAIPAVIEERGFRRIQILRGEFPDCADLADDIAEAFRTAWADPTILPGKPWGDLKEGIWIVGPRDDPRSPVLLSILSEVLGAEYEPIGLNPTPPAPLDFALVIRIDIGRKPRHN